MSCPCFGQLLLAQLHSLAALLGLANDATTCERVDVQMKDAIRVNRRCAGARDPEVCAAVTNMWYNPPVPSRNCGAGGAYESDEGPPSHLADVVRARHAEAEALRFRKAVAWAQDLAGELPRPSPPAAPLATGAESGTAFRRRGWPARLPTLHNVAYLSPLHPVHAPPALIPAQPSAAAMAAGAATAAAAKAAAIAQARAVTSVAAGGSRILLMSSLPPSAAPGDGASHPAEPFRMVPPALAPSEAMRTCAMKATGGDAGEPEAFRHTSLRAPLRRLPRGCTAAGCLAPSRPLPAPATFTCATPRSAARQAIAAALRIDALRVAPDCEAVALAHAPPDAHAGAQSADSTPFSVGGAGSQPYINEQHKASVVPEATGVGDVPHVHVVADAKVRHIKLRPAQQPHGGATNSCGGGGLQTSCMSETTSFTAAAAPSEQPERPTDAAARLRACTTDRAASSNCTQQPCRPVHIQLAHAIATQQRPAGPAHQALQTGLGKENATLQEWFAALPAAGPPAARDFTSWLWVPTRSYLFHAPALVPAMLPKGLTHPLAPPKRDNAASSSAHGDGVRCALPACS
jgi:hypothetical protein